MVVSGCHGSFRPCSSLLKWESPNGKFVCSFGTSQNLVELLKTRNQVRCVRDVPGDGEGIRVGCRQLGAERCNPVVVQEVQVQAGEPGKLPARVRPGSRLQATAGQLRPPNR